MRFDRASTDHSIFLRAQRRRVSSHHSVPERRSQQVFLLLVSFLPAMRWRFQTDSRILFRYTYDITQTLQKNFTRAHDKTSGSSLKTETEDHQPRWNDKFVWNHKLLVPMLQHLRHDSPWVLPMIYGSIEQASERSLFPSTAFIRGSSSVIWATELSVFGRTIYICLIARRSRHFAGARYRRRGVTEDVSSLPICSLLSN